MEFRQLKYFLAVADHGSLCKAATRLFIAQSALSQQVFLLEQDVGVSLLHRSSKGVTLTESGKTFYEHAQAIMRQIADARSAALQQSSNGPTGVVVLGIPQSVSAALALPLLLAVREALPGVTLQLTEELTGNLIEPLRLGRLNLAILFDDGQLKEFARKHIAEEQMFLLSKAPEKRPCANKRIKLDDALRYCLILPSVQHGVRQRIEKIASEHGHAIENIGAEINSINILKSAIMANVGSTILSLAPFRFELNQGLISAQEIYGPGISRTIVVCGSRNVPVTKATAAVSKLIVEVSRELCKKGEWEGACPIYHDHANMAA